MHMICITDDDLFVSNTKPKPISKTRRSSLIAQSHLRHVPTEYTLSPEEPNFPLVPCSELTEKDYCLKYKSCTWKFHNSRGYCNDFSPPCYGKSKDQCNAQKLKDNSCYWGMKSKATHVSPTPTASRMQRVKVLRLL